MSINCFFCDQSFKRSDYQDAKYCPISFFYCKVCKAIADSSLELQKQCTCAEFDLGNREIGYYCLPCATKKFDLVEPSCSCCKKYLAQRPFLYLCVKCKGYHCKVVRAYCFTCNTVTRKRCACPKPSKIGLCGKCCDEEYKDIILMYYDVNYSVKGGS